MNDLPKGHHPDILYYPTRIKKTSSFNFQDISLMVQEIIKEDTENKRRERDRSVDLGSSTFLNPTSLNTPIKILHDNQFYDDYSTFDAHCAHMYGEKTCILIQINETDMNIRFLDKIQYGDEYKSKSANRSELYNIIPKILAGKYTVVVVEYVDIFDTLDIVSIHTPHAFKMRF